MSNLRRCTFGRRSVNITMSRATDERACEAAVDPIFGLDPPAFAILHRPAATGRDRLEVLVGDMASVDTLADLPLPESWPVHAAQHDLLALVPYRQVAEQGFAHHDDGAPLLAMSVRAQHTMRVSELMRRIPDEPVRLGDGDFDIDDETYGAMVRKIVVDEIGRGEGSNFVIKRTFVAEIENYSVPTALRIFRRLMGHELGAYWTFIVHTGDRTLIGATPERHVSLAGGVAVMNPISGTYRYPESGPALDGVLRFLDDGKEAGELLMVLDEELKMMGRLCQAGGRVEGPFLKEMASLAHTEYILRGRTSLDVRQILRETLLAPTVTGSPLESACRVIERYEGLGRGYYGGVLALIGRTRDGQRTLDSSIAIRTADIDLAGRMRLGVGATLVRNSVPEAEVAETWAKAAGLLAVFDPPDGSGGPVGPTAPATVAAAPPGPASHATRGTYSAEPMVRQALTARNVNLGRFWFDPASGRGPGVPGLSGRHILVIDAEDAFTSMLAHQVRSLGPTVTVRRFDERYQLDRYDLVVVGPGPGDPRDDSHPKIANLLELTRRLVKEEIPFLSICLGHQVLGSLLGLELIRRTVPNQGAQREIDFFGERRRVGFYNTFALRSEVDQLDGIGTRGAVDLSREAGTDEVFGLRGPDFRSVQFHPESILTENGPEILAGLIRPLLPVPTGRAGSRARSGSAVRNGPVAQPTSPPFVSDVDVLHGELLCCDAELLGLVKKRTSLAHRLGAARSQAGGTRFVHDAELSLVRTYHHLGPSGVELATLLLRLGR
jgi:phenazine biosynthesis protein phzE